MNTPAHANSKAALLFWPLLAAASTSVYCAVFALVLWLLLSGLQQAMPKTSPLQQAFAALVVIFIGAMTIVLMPMIATDLPEAYAHLVVLACVAACATSGKPSLPSWRHALLLPVAAALVELFAWGTLPVDREFAFAGQLREFEMRIVDLRLLPSVATPAGATLLCAALLFITGGKRAANTEAKPDITTPRAGRRVRVTGNIR